MIVGESEFVFGVRQDVVFTTLLKPAPPWACFAARVCLEAPKLLVQPTGVNSVPGSEADNRSRLLSI